MSLDSSVKDRWHLNQADDCDPTGAEGMIDLLHVEPRRATAALQGAV